MLNRKLLLAVAALGLAGAAYAGGQNDAGCGLGSMLFKEDKPAHQIVASVTNQFASQSIGITFGTMGCTSGGLIKAGREREVFVATNLRVLQRELAVGKGEFAASLGTLMGCGKDSAGFLRLGKARYDAIFPTASTSATEALDNLSAVLAADPTMSKACGS